MSDKKLFFQLNSIDERIIDSAKSIISKKLKVNNGQLEDNSDDKVRALQVLVKEQDASIRRLEKKIDALLNKL